MIGTIEVKVNAYNPSVALPILFSYIGSPSSMRIVNVPKKIGSWCIDQVQVAAHYPDNSVKSTTCKLIGGAWVGTIDGSTLAGKSVNGWQITASGVDENGDRVSGYVIGKGDVVVLSNDGRIEWQGTTWYLHLLDNFPTAPVKGDVVLDDGLWKVYNGSSWTALGANVQFRDIQGNPHDNDELGDELDYIGDNIIHLQQSVAATSPSTTAPENALAGARATANFVNSSINAFAAYYITKDSSGNPFGTYAQLSSATQFYNAGQVRWPTKNDYCIVSADETKTTAAGTHPTTRYMFVGEGSQIRWEYQYTLNDTPFTQAQLDALNSTATKDKIDQIAETEMEVQQTYQVAVDAYTLANDAYVLASDAVVKSGDSGSYQTMAGGLHIQGNGTTELELGLAFPLQISELYGIKWSNGYRLNIDFAGGDYYPAFYNTSYGKVTVPLLTSFTGTDSLVLRSQLQEVVGNLEYIIDRI